MCVVNPRSLEGGGGSCTFNTIHPIDMKLGTYNKLHLYFQLSETAWCLIGFQGNNTQINDVTGSCHLGVQIVTFVLQNDDKTAFSG